jgi:hypothetical protein
LEDYIASIFRVEEYAKQEIGMKQAATRSDFLLGLLFDSEDGGDMFPRNVGYLSSN